MKTYNEYLKIIQDREYEEDRPRREAMKKEHEKHKDNLMILSCFCVTDVSGINKMTFDYSVEIMGMMMKDFLEEFKLVFLLPLSFVQQSLNKIYQIVKFLQGRR